MALAELVGRTRRRLQTTKEEEESWCIDDALLGEGGGGCGASVGTRPLGCYIVFLYRPVLVFAIISAV